MLPREIKARTDCLVRADDSRLVSPVLLTSKIVIFNWKDSLQADRILNLLAVLARAAQGIELDEDDGIKVFGHLHLCVLLSILDTPWCYAIADSNSGL